MIDARPEAGEARYRKGTIHQWCRVATDELVEQRASRDHAAAVSVRFPDQIRDDLRVRGGDVVAFAGVVGEVEQQRRVVFGARLALSVRPARDEVRFEPVLADRSRH